MLAAINSAWRIVGPLMLVAVVMAAAWEIRVICSDVIDDLWPNRVRGSKD